MLIKKQDKLLITKTLLLKDSLNKNKENIPKNRPIKLETNSEILEIGH